MKLYAAAGLGPLLRDDYPSVHVVSAALSLALMLGGNTLHNNPTASDHSIAALSKSFKNILKLSQTQYPVTFLPLFENTETVLWSDRAAGVNVCVSSRRSEQ